MDRGRQDRLPDPTLQQHPAGSLSMMQQGKMTPPNAAAVPRTEVEPVTAEVLLRQRLLLPRADSLPPPPATVVSFALARAAAEAKTAAEAASAARSRVEEEARVGRKRQRSPAASPAATREPSGGAGTREPPHIERSRSRSRSCLHEQITGLARLAAPDQAERKLRHDTAQAYAALVAGAIPGAQVCPDTARGTSQRLSLPLSLRLSPRLHLRTRSQLCLHPRLRLRLSSRLNLRLRLASRYLYRSTCSVRAPLG